MCQHSEQSTTPCQHRPKKNTKETPEKPNEKTKLTKHNQENKGATTTTFSSFLQVLVFPFQLFSCYTLVQALYEHKLYHLHLQLV